jgi:hypothetical protein
MFSEEDEDFLQSLPLNMCDQTLMQMWKEEKEKKKKMKRQKLDKRKVKRKK